MFLTKGVRKKNGLKRLNTKGGGGGGGGGILDKKG